MADEVDDAARTAADETIAAVRVALRLLESVPHATVRAKAVGLVLAEWPELHRLPKEIRQQAAQTMNDQGLVFPEIGRLIGTDRSRVWRIAKGI
ncbi:hypothetical protein [Streptomyces xantholiticus]|uniref:hypothetical protein n=1 Tax=Streptomyces xantholiticus TaxID=68285 RepID=UPI00167993BF|nr:hypothetical protein [Streptomyces xantholiticus]